MGEHQTEKETTNYLFDSMAFPSLDNIFQSSDTVNEFLDLFRSIGSKNDSSNPPSPRADEKQAARSRSSSLGSFCHGPPADPALEFLVCPHAAASLAQAGLGLDSVASAGDVLGGAAATPPSSPVHDPNEDSEGNNDNEDDDHDEEYSETAAPAGTRTTTKKRRTRKVYEPEQRVYFNPTDKDVLCQRGGLSNSHEGNKRFRSTKDDLQALYFATPKLERTHVSQKLVDVVHAWGGHFLRKDASGWYEVHNHVARTKAGQALRETCAPEDRAAKRAKYAKKKNAKRKSNQ